MSQAWRVKHFVNGFKPVIYISRVLNSSFLCYFGFWSPKFAWNRIFYIFLLRIQENINFSDFHNCTVKLILNKQIFFKTLATQFNSALRTYKTAYYSLQFEILKFLNKLKKYITWIFLKAVEILDFSGKKQGKQEHVVDLIPFSPQEFNLNLKQILTQVVFESFYIKDLNSD